MRVGERREEDTMFDSLRVEREEFCNGVKVSHFVEDGMACFHRQQLAERHC